MSIRSKLAGSVKCDSGYYSAIQTRSSVLEARRVPLIKTVSTSLKNSQVHIGKRAYPAVSTVDMTVDNRRGGHPVSSISESGLIVVDVVGINLSLDGEQQKRVVARHALGAGDEHSTYVG